MNIKRNIIFTLESRKEYGILIVENVPIRMRVNFASKRTEFTAGYRIGVARWNSDKQRIRNGCTNKLKQSVSEIDASLLSYYIEVQEIFKKFEVEGIMPTPEQIKEAFNALRKPIEKEVKPKRSTPNALYKVSDEFVRDCGQQDDWTDSTCEKFAAARNHLINFRDGLTFGFFDEKGLGNYVTYLCDIEEMHNSAVDKQLSFLRWLLRWAFKNGVHQNDTYDSCKPKLKSTQEKIIFLTWEELNKLREFEIPAARQALDRVCNVFLFQCSTGLRYSDVFNLRRSDIKGDRIEVTTVETSDSLTIELNNHSKVILDKYKDVVFEDDKVLSVITDQKVNDYLKELAELAGIDEPVRQAYYRGNEHTNEVTPKYALLGTHTGHRIFICNALALGIPPQVVMRWIRYSDYKAMKPYTDIAGDIKASAMSKFN